MSVTKEVAPVSDSVLYNQAQADTVAMCIYGDSSVERVLEIVGPDTFMDEKYHAIMTAIVTVHRRNEPVSVLSVSGELENKGLLKFVGNTERIYELYRRGEKVTLSNTPTVLANILKESQAKYSIKNLLVETKDFFTDDSGVTARDAIEDLQGQLSDIVLSLNDNATTITSKTFMPSYMDLLKERKRVAEENKETSGGLQGIPTLLPSLNKYTSGFCEGQLITVGAKTGVGKSVFAIMTAISALKAGKSVVFFSLEMSEEEIFDRIVANMSQVSLNNLKEGNLTVEEEERVAKSVKELKEAPLVIDTDPKTTIDAIRSKSIRQQQSEDGLDIVIVDYLQLISASERFNSRQELVSDLSRNMKLMAKSLNIPVMILTQLNRGNNSDDEDDHPKLDQIRESGAIAQDSDIVILLHREKSIDNKSPQTLILLEKNRRGESNKIIRCHTELAFSDFREVKKSQLGEEKTGEHNDNNALTENNENTSTMDDFYNNVSDDDFFDSDSFEL